MIKKFDIIYIEDKSSISCRVFDYVQNTYVHKDLTDLYDKVEESGLSQ